MKKIVKVLLIAAAVFMVLGIGLSVAGAVMGAGSSGIWHEFRHRMNIPLHGDFDFWDDYDWDDESKCFTTPEITNENKVSSGKNAEKANTKADAGDSTVYTFQDKDRLEIDLSYDELVLEESDGQDITVEVYHDSQGDVLVEENGDTLEISSYNKTKEHRTVKVAYPKNMKFQEAELTVDTGELFLNSDFRADELDITIGAGAFENTGKIIAREASLEVGTGSMKLTGLDAQDISGECGVGNMELQATGEKVDYSYSLECGIGKILLDGEEYSGLGREKEIHNPGAGKYLELECGIGSVTVDFEKGANEA